MDVILRRHILKRIAQSKVDPFCICSAECFYESFNGTPVDIAQYVETNRFICFSFWQIFQCVFWKRMTNGEASWSSVVLIQVEASLLLNSSSVTFMDFYLGQITHWSHGRRKKKNKPEGLFRDTPIRHFSYTFLLSCLLYAPSAYQLSVWLLIKKQWRI